MTNLIHRIQKRSEIFCSLFRLKIQLTGTTYSKTRGTRSIISSPFRCTFFSEIFLNICYFKIVLTFFTWKVWKIILTLIYMGGAESACSVLDCLILPAGQGKKLQILRLFLWYLWASAHEEIFFLISFMV